MKTYRIRETAEIVTESRYRALHPTTSFPAVFTPDDADEVHTTPAPEVGQYQTAYRNGVEEAETDEGTQWQDAWSVRDWTEEEIAAYQAGLVPEFVTMRQARKALLYSGMIEVVEAFLAGMPDGEPMTETHDLWEAKRDAQIEWLTSDTVRRDNPLVAAAAAYLELTTSQLDNLFIYARTIV